MALIVTAALLAAACQGGSDPADEGLLAIVDQDGELVVLTADGDVVAGPTNLGDDTEVFQPIWSGPEHLVYVEQGPVGGTLVVATTGGDEQRRVDFATAPFYVYPRPGGAGSADIVTLRNHVEGGLAAEIIHDDGTFSALEGDFPFFFTWTGEGEVAAHSENASLDVVYPNPKPIATALGQFGAPGSSDNDLVFVRSSGPATFLTHLVGGEPADLAAVQGLTRLVVGGDRVAVHSVSSGDAPGAVEARAQPVPLLPGDTLAVVGLDDGVITRVANDGVVVFFFDHTGRRLLYLTVDEPGQFSWHVWEDGSVTDFSTFELDPSWFLNFAQFFDQYAQSMSLWSPDGAAFAFPGTVAGEPGVWVQQLDQTEPVRISTGSWVAWGPAG